MCKVPLIKHSWSTLRIKTAIYILLFSVFFLSFYSTSSFAQPPPKYESINRNQQLEYSPNEDDILILLRGLSFR